MSSAGKWILGLLLLVLGAVFVARTVSSDPASLAEPKVLPSAETVAKTEKTKAPPAPATDVACKKACIEVNEVANDSVTTAKLAPGSVTLSKLAFEVPNLNELENEITARKAAEAASKAAAAEAKVALGEAAAATAKNDAAITAAAQNGLVAEAAARNAAVDDITKKFIAGDADLLGRLNREIADRGAGDDVLQLKLNTEIADRAGAINTLRGELGNPNQVGAPIVKINNNEIVGDAVTSDKVKDGNITADDLGNDSVVGGLGGDVKDESITSFDLGAASVGTSEVIDDSIAAVDLANNAVVGRGIAADAGLINVKERTLRGERTNNSTADTSAGDLALGTITGEAAPLAGSATGNIALGTIGTGNLANGAVTFTKLDNSTQNRIVALETGLAAEIVNRIADVDAEELARTNRDVALQAAIDAEALARTNRDVALQAAIDAEGLSRAAADANLQSQLNSEITAREAGDAAQAAALTALRDQLSTADAAAASQPNDGDGLVDWTNLEGVPSGFADGTDDDGTTGLNAYKNELKNAGTADTTVDEGDDDVSWFKLRDVPAGFKDGTDAIDGGLAADLACTGCVDANDLGNDSVESAEIKNGTITAADLAGTYGSDPAQTETTPGAVTSEKIADGTILGRDLASGAVGAANLGADVITRFEAVESRATVLETRLNNLAAAPAPGDTDRVHTTRLTGQVNVTQSLDPDPVVATTRSEQIIAMPVAGQLQVGDMVTVSPPPLLADDLLFVGYEVQDRLVGGVAQAVVVVYLYNNTAVTIDDGPNTWKIQILDLTP